MVFHKAFAAAVLVSAAQGVAGSAGCYDKNCLDVTHDQGTYNSLLQHGSQKLASSKDLDALKVGGAKETKEQIIPEDDALRALKVMGDAIRNLRDKATCKFETFGSGWGEHTLCARNYTSPCTALSYGISTDYSFDLDVQKRMGCRVFSLDPTINHRAELAPNVYFMKWGAPMLPDTEASVSNSTDNWTSISPARLASMMAPGESIPILKMDCEGCEYALYQGVMASDPDFFKRVDQFAVEVHLSKFFMKGRREMIEYGRLLSLLFATGFELQDQSLMHCAEEKEATGLLPEFHESGYFDTINDVVRLLTLRRGHCENFLFAKTSGSIR
eukprot:TRINITY_DN90778_c0_g1_i1.p1 TRINITY_DN90778_c0_g1~~TRINITY_DN90778_c0_g1_i1.p1  ORF type:complete len:351 (+),score=62.99 TRINITY_DN90778_c0_g1_i1:67-1053(+)